MEYTIEETAQLLKLSVSTIRRRIKAGTLNARLVQGQYQITLPTAERSEAQSQVEIDRLRNEVERLTINNARLLALTERLTRMLEKRVDQ